MYSKTREERIDLLMDDIVHILKVCGPSYMYLIDKVIYDRFPGIHRGLNLKPWRTAMYVKLYGRDRIHKVKGKNNHWLYYLPGQDYEFILKQPHDRYRKRVETPDNYNEVLKDVASDVYEIVQ